VNDFFERVRKAFERNESCLCVGLDPVIERIPDSIRNSEEPLFDFLAPIIDTTAELVCAYKPNIAFYEAEGSRGVEQLRRIIKHIRSLDDDIPIILDAKRGDIGNTARAYARAVFDDMCVDATTVNPYMGGDTLEPFLDRNERGIFILCLTSNPGYTDFENLIAEESPVFVNIARKASGWNAKGNIGLVVGATHPDDAEKVRDAAPELPFLMPGIGAQGGDPARIMKIGFTASGFPPIVNSSRSILYANDGENYAEASRQAALKTRDNLNRFI